MVKLRIDRGASSLITNLGVMRIRSMAILAPIVFYEGELLYDGAVSAIKGGWDVPVVFSGVNSVIAGMVYMLAGTVALMYLARGSNDRIVRACSAIGVVATIGFWLGLAAGMVGVIVPQTSR